MTEVDYAVPKEPLIENLRETGFDTSLLAQEISMFCLGLIIILIIIIIYIYYLVKVQDKNTTGCCSAWIKAFSKKKTKTKAVTQANGGAVEVRPPVEISNHENQNKIRKMTSIGHEQEHVQLDSNNFKGTLPKIVISLPENENFDKFQKKNTDIPSTSPQKVDQGVFGMDMLAVEHHFKIRRASTIKE